MCMYIFLAILSFVSVVTKWPEHISPIPCDVFPHFYILVLRVFLAHLKAHRVVILDTGDTPGTPCRTQYNTLSTLYHCPHLYSSWAAPVLSTPSVPCPHYSSHSSPQCPSAVLHAEPGLVYSILLACHSIVRILHSSSVVLFIIITMDIQAIIQTLLPVYLFVLNTQISRFLCPPPFG